MERSTRNWLPIVLAVGLAVLILTVALVWFIGASSDVEEEQRVTVEQEQPEQPPVQEQQPVEEPPSTQTQEPSTTPERTVITNSREVREVIRERPVYVYIERPEQAEPDEQSEVVAVPQGQESQYSGDSYERTQLPSQLTVNGSTYYIAPGETVRLDPATLRSTGQSVAGNPVYTLRDATSADTIYVRIDQRTNRYVPYERVMDEQRQPSR